MKYHNYYCEYPRNITKIFLPIWTQFMLYSFVNMYSFYQNSLTDIYRVNHPKIRMIHTAVMCSKKVISQQTDMSLHSL